VIGRMRHAKIQLACVYCQTVRLHFIHDLTLISGFAMYAAKARQLKPLYVVRAISAKFRLRGVGWGGGVHMNLNTQEKV
jgi:hypothetical protein